MYSYLRDFQGTLLSGSRFGSDITFSRAARWQFRQFLLAKTEIAGAVGSLWLSQHRTSVAEQKNGPVPVSINGHAVGRCRRLTVGGDHRRCFGGLAQIAVTLLS